MKYVVKGHVHVHYETVVEAKNMAAAQAIWYDMMEKGIRERQACTYENVRSTAQEYSEEAAEAMMTSMEPNVPTGYFYKDEHGVLHYKDLVDGVSFYYDEDGNPIKPGARKTKSPSK